MKLDIWDTTGNKGFRSLNLTFFGRQTHAFILVYDITRQDSLQNSREWFDILRDQSFQNVFTALAGNKADLVDAREVTYEVICVLNHINGLCQA